MNKKSITDSLVIGATLFATFFGAGNMIFPPYLGLEGGDQWLWGFLGFYIADVGLAVIAIGALVKRDTFSSILSPLGRVAATVLTLSAVLCLGPLISVPRTCATTFELAVLPLFENANLYLFSPVFFVITLLLSLNESKIVDIVGKILTPMLVAGLLFLILKGVLSPISTKTGPVRVTSPLGSGISAGYQSMDVLGAAILDSLIIGGAVKRGYSSKDSRRKVVMLASAVAGAGLFVIYLGLTYLGATASTVFNMHTSRTQLLTGIVNFIIPGKLGLILFGGVAGLACLTTSVALTGAAAKYFEGLTGGKLSYRLSALLISAVSCLLSMLGVERIISVASPVLTVVYPPILVMILFSFFHKYLSPLSYRIAAAAATAYGVAEVLTDTMSVSPLRYLPFSNVGLGWIVPCVLLALLVRKYRLLNKKQK